jgi:hypothetical protein
MGFEATLLNYLKFMMSLANLLIPYRIDIGLRIKLWLQGYDAIGF